MPASADGGSPDGCHTPNGNHSPDAGDLPNTSDLPDSKWISSLRRKMLAWFQKHARDLPWRTTPDPYRVWVSEIMLQQTQVVTVVSYFNRFIDRFPDVRTLADADEQEVLCYWEGLGYYRRARQLHAAARKLAGEHRGEFPRTVDGLTALPGVGRYTAGAILSIAFDIPAPILEANTIRLFSRLLAWRENPTTSASQRVLWSFAESVLPKKRAGRLNQSLMELGSEICTPRSPDCNICPVSTLCPTHAASLQDQIPAPKQKTNYENVRHAAIVISRGDRVLIRRCQPDERWAGLWDFPRFELDDAPAPDQPTDANQLQAVSELADQEGRRLSEDERIVQETRELTGLQVELNGKLATIKHGVTRYRIELQCRRATCCGGRLKRGEFKWVKLPELNDYPLSTTGRKISRLVQAQSVAGG